MSIFTKVPQTKVSSNTFDLSHDRKMSMKMGDLVPIHVMEIVPGDNIQMSTSQMLRMAPMIAPVMHRVNAYTHFFFVPNRLIWDKWEEFITGGEDGESTAVFPYISYAGGGGNLERLPDYMGLPAGGTTFAPAIEVSAIPFGAYQMIYNEYYRDQNLIEPVTYKVVDGDNGNPNIDPDAADLVEMHKRAWQHDYFTSALPWTQKGPEATIPIGDVQYRGSGAPILRRLVDDSVAVTGAQSILSGSMRDSGSQTLYLDPNSTLEAGGGTINELRRAIKLQEWLEKNARGGSRYIESILSHFGVRSSDARLNRPEYLGGGSSSVTISEVLQTSNNDTQDTPQGNMAGHGISVGASNSFSYTAEEHGYIIGIMSIMPKTAYQQGVPKHWMKFDKFDYYWPSFAHLGEQPIYYKEIYAQTNGSDTNDLVFGYTPRYAEYKFMNSSVHGQFRTTLDFWHMGRIFSNIPQLNKAFIESDPTTRIFAVTETEQIYCHIFHRIKARRKMPYFGTPTI